MGFYSLEVQAQARLPEVDPPLVLLSIAGNGGQKRQRTPSKGVESSAKREESRGGGEAGVGE